MPLSSLEETRSFDTFDTIELETSYCEYGQLAIERTYGRADSSRMRRHDRRASVGVGDGERRESPPPPPPPSATDILLKTHLDLVLPQSFLSGKKHWKGKSTIHRSPINKSKIYHHGYCCTEEEEVNRRRFINNNKNKEEICPFPIFDLLDDDDDHLETRYIDFREIEHNPRSGRLFVKGQEQSNSSAVVLNKIQNVKTKVLKCITPHLGPPSPPTIYSHAVSAVRFLYNEE